MGESVAGGLGRRGVTGKKDFAGRRLDCRGRRLPRCAANRRFGRFVSTADLHVFFFAWLAFFQLLWRLPFLPLRRRHAPVSCCDRLLHLAVPVSVDTQTSKGRPAVRSLRIDAADSASLLRRIRLLRLDVVLIFTQGTSVLHDDVVLFVEGVESIDFCKAKVLRLESCCVSNAIRS